MSMTALRALRRLVATSLAGLLVGPMASAAPLEAVYEGSLVPESFDAPFPITAELRDLQGVIVGQVKVGAPYSGSAPIASGDFDGGRCTLRAPINPGTVLRLSGTCHPRLFEGRYTLSSSRKEGSSTGSFRLMRKADFRLYANGEAQLIEVERSSGDLELDQAAILAVVNAHPFPPFPGHQGLAY